MTRWRIRDALVVDPFRRVVRREDVGVADGRVVPLAQVADAPEARFPGCWVVPRVTDLHVHLRDPGQTWKEDWQSGTRAAAAGGVTVIAVMPNTVPVADQPALIRRMQAPDAGRAPVHVWPIAAVTRRSGGREAAPWAALAEAGARAFSDDGRPVSDSGILARILSWSRDSRRPVIQHLEDLALSAGGVAHAGPAADRWRLPGIPGAAESVMAWRDVALLDEVGGFLHFAHCSVPGTLEALEWGRRRGLHLTGEAAPHHLLLTEAALSEWQGSAVTKVNPPLRPASFREALRAAVARGVVDVVASDHAPHARAEKELPYREAPFGISGLETLVAVTLTVLRGEMGLGPLEALGPLTVGPHRVMGETFPGLVPGAPADLTVINPDAHWTVDPSAFYSRGRNTPLAGHTLIGRPVATMLAGRFTYRDGEVLS